MKTLKSYTENYEIQKTHFNYGVVYNNEECVFVTNDLKKALHYANEWAKCLDHEGTYSIVLKGLCIYKVYTTRK